MAVITTVIAGAVGRHYATDFSLPGTESQHVVDLLNGEFPAQSGDIDTIVWHTPSGTVDDANVRNQIEPLLAKATKMPHVVSVVSPYDQAGAVQVSKDGARHLRSSTTTSARTCCPTTPASPCSTRSRR